MKLTAGEIGLVAFLVASAMLASRLGYHDTSMHLLVGVLSARDHFEARESIRDTWWGFVKYDVRLKGVFVVGESCCVPPEDRTEVYECSWWNVTLPEDVSESREFAPSPGTEMLEPAWGFTFYVHHPVVLTKLVIHDALLHYNVSAKMAMSSGELVAEYSPGQKDRKDIMLPKGFEGMVVLEGSEDPSRCFSWPPDTTGLISYPLVVDKGGAFKVPRDTCVPVGFTFKLADLDALRSFLAGRPSRQIKWTSAETEIDSRLQREADDNSDLLIVPAVDVYRNLPLKLIKFFQWAATSTPNTPRFILKADDDTYLWIPSILSHIHWDQSKMWWGSFRLNWAVQRMGKWRERHFTSLTYPPFASGSAYLLDSELTSQLAKNAEHLQCFQGEDVSLGVWLSPFTHTRIHDERWDCGQSFGGGYSLGQLNPQSMKEVHLRTKESGHLC